MPIFLRKIFQSKGRKFAALALVLALAVFGSNAFAGVSFFQRSGTITPNQVQKITAGATPAINADLGNVWTLTPGEGETISVSGGSPGERYSLVVTTSGTSSYTLTFGTGFKTTGTLATGTSDAKVFVVSFVHDGISFKETGRTTAM